MTIATAYHQPVMVQEVVSALQIKPGGAYIDLTFGGGGHTKAILAQLGDGKLWAFDQDLEAKQEAEALQDDRVYFIQGNFRCLSHFLHAYQVPKADGILADLGVSSHQLNSRERGFAARLEGPLDMRMHQAQGDSAAEVVNTYTRNALQTAFADYGDIRNAGRLAAHLVEVREKKPVTTIAEFKEAIAPCVPKGREYKYYAKVFQALRMVVNEEIPALQEMLLQIPTALAADGRFVVITYHSGEDRPVKRFLKTGNFQGEPRYDPYGNLLRPLAPLYRKVLRPGAEEVQENNRARSARLRVATLWESAKERISSSSKS